MVKTKRNHKKSHHGTMRHKEDACERTFYGLQKWHDCKFEKLGWMILAKKKGYHEKVNEYLKSIDRLEEAIEHKMEHMHDNDKCDDLEILLHNVKTLQEHARRDLH
jgi:hypothetical protein